MADPPRRLWPAGILLVDPRVAQVYYTCMPEIPYEQTIREVAEHLARQQTPSVMVRPNCLLGGVCAYRGANGARCAVGIFLSDDVAGWADDQATSGVSYLCSKDGDEADEFRSAVDARGRGLCRELQVLHDSAATKNGLTTDGLLAWWRDCGIVVAQHWDVDPSIWTEPFDKALARSRGQ